MNCRVGGTLRALVGVPELRPGVTRQKVACPPEGYPQGNSWALLEPQPLPGTLVEKGNQMHPESLELRCQCGEMSGAVSFARPSICNHLVCYCGDCQRFARHLGEGPWLDEHGGTEIVQVTPRQISISSGVENLRVLRLTPKGPLRWHTACCNTPVANTPAAGLPFAGIFASLMIGPDKERVIGPVTARVQGQHAVAPPPGLTIHRAFPPLLTARIMFQMLIGKARGLHRPSPFFRVDGQPISTPVVLDPA